MERETGFEPATNSLEGCDSTPELLPLNLPQELNGGEWRIRTSVGRGPADLQSAAFDRSANSPLLIFGFWSWRRDSNPRPADYKSAALPTELCQRQFHDFKDTISL